MQQRRVTQRDLARAAGVSRPTVSLALRHHPGIPAATRHRILELAEKMGYTPDPALSVLAAYRWPASSLKRSIVSIALVGFAPPRASATANYCTAVSRGAISRAKSLGLSVSTFNLADYAGNIAQMLRVLRTRGITGIILLPSDRPITLDTAAPWDAFSVVTATTSVLAPRFHQVMPNQLYNMTALLTRMHQLGHRKIGAIFSEIYEECTTHSYSMALAWFGHRGRILILRGKVSPAENSRRIAAWLRAHELDLVFAPHADGLARLVRPGKSPRSNSRLRLVSVADYIEQFPGLIGETAVRVLSGLMYNNETGIPSHPQITTIDGTIREDRIPARTR